MIAWLLTAALAADRAAPPPVTPPVPIALAEPEVRAVGDGVRVLYARVPGVAKVELRLILHRGALDLDGWPTPAAHATGWLQDVATAAYDADAMAEIRDLHAIELWSWVAPHRAGVDLTAPIDGLDRAVELLGEVVHRPTFPAGELRRYRRDVLRYYGGEAATQASTVAGDALTYAWAPADHPFGARPDLDAWRGVRRRDLRERHRRLLEDAPVTLLVVGDIEPDALHGRLVPVLEGLGAPGGDPEWPSFTPPAASRVVAVDRPGATQVNVRVRFAAPPLGDADRAAVELLDFALGGSFLSRINRVLREEKGLTYGAWSAYDPDRTTGSWTIGVEVPAARAGEAIGDIGAAIASVCEAGLGQNELAAARNARVAGWNRALETSSSAVAFYEQRVLDGESVADVRARIDAMAAIDGPATRDVAARWWGANRPRVWVVVGDRATLEPQLAALGAPIVWITPEQGILGEL